jgi:hypothetical protein
MMTGNIHLLSARLTMLGLGVLGAGALSPLPAFAGDDPPPSQLMDQQLINHMRADGSYPPAPRLEPRLAPDPRRTQIADGVQSTTSSSSTSASSSASSSVTVTGGKQGKCKAEASAHAQANGVEDSDHDLKVVEGDGCSAKAESSATVKPHKQQSE